MNQQQDFKMMEKFINVRINTNCMCSNKLCIADTPKGAVLHTEKISLMNCIKENKTNKIGYVFVTKSNVYLFKDLERIDLENKFIVVSDRQKEKNKITIMFNDIAHVLDIKKRTF